MSRTYNELFDPPITLTLEQEGSNYIVCDGDTVYLRSPDLEMCKRFMVAMQAKQQAVIDMDSYHWFQLLAEQHSFKVPDLPDNVRPIRLAR